MTLEALYYIFRIVAVTAILGSLIAIFFQRRLGQQIARVDSQRDLPNHTAEFLKLTLAAFAAAMLLSTSAFAEDSAPAPFASVQTRLEATIAAGSVPSISIAVVQDGSVKWIASYGLADIAAKAHATPDTVYRVGSLCKSITGTVATIAEQDGDINLARPITEFLPRLSLLSGGRFRTASLVALLDMRAGMTQAVHYRGLELDPPGLDGDAFVDRFSLAPVREARSYSYSNMGPELVARAIAAATGRDFATYAEHKLFSPLGMTSTYFSAAEVPEARRAQSYKQSMKPFKRLFETDPRAGAGCLTSARDLSAYMIFHLTGRSPSATTLLSEANLDSDHTPASGGFYRRGWGRVLAGDHAILISDGQINGGQAVILLDPAKRAGAAVLTNVVYDDVYDIAASALNEMDPGIAVSFANAFSALRRDRERELASVYPPPGTWSAQGTVIADGRSHHLAVTNARDFLSIQIDGGVQIRAKDDGRDDGFMKWPLPCAKFLPLCIEGTKADADLYLTRDGDALAGVIAVDSLLGLFPYEVRLRPSPQ